MEPSKVVYEYYDESHFWLNRARVLFRHRACLYDFFYNRRNVPIHSLSLHLWSDEKTKWIVVLNEIPYKEIRPRHQSDDLNKAIEYALVLATQIIDGV